MSEEQAQNTIEGALIEIRQAFFKSRESIQVLIETGHRDKVMALEEAEAALSKALSEYARVFNEGAK